MLTKKLTFFALSGVIFAGNAVAAKNHVDPVAQVQEAIALASQSLTSGAKVASFNYRPSKIYEISIKPGIFTTFTFPKGEVIKEFALSAPDAAEISVNEETSSAMLRLEVPITMSATIVTSKNTYYLTIVPAPTGQWHQGVSWVTSGGENDVGGSGGFGFRSAANANDPYQQQFTSEDSLSGQPNFNYALEGDKDILPIAVWDNGRFTWLQFPDNVQSIPAIFFLGSQGPEVINYTVMPGGKQVKINRLRAKIMLRIGNKKAIVTAK